MANGHSDEVDEQYLYELSDKLSEYDIGLLVAYWLYKRDRTDISGIFEFDNKQYEFNCYEK